MSYILTLLEGCREPGAGCRMFDASIAWRRRTAPSASRRAGYGGGPQTEMSALASGGADQGQGSAVVADRRIPRKIRNGFENRGTYTLGSIRMRRLHYFFDPV